MKILRQSPLLIAEAISKGNTGESVMTRTMATIPDSLPQLFALFS